QLTGQLDMSKTNTTQGNLKLAADSLDVTSYYDLFNNDKKPAPANKPPPPSRKKPSASAASAQAQPAEEIEPEPKQLPLQNFTADINIGRFYLREMEMTNFQAIAKIDGGKVAIKPFQAAINGGPINATVQLNLGVPGYSYDLNCSAMQVPLAPLVNTFVPERR